MHRRLGLRYLSGWAPVDGSGVEGVIQMRVRIGAWFVVVMLLVVAGCGEEVQPVTVTGAMPSPVEETKGEHIGDPIPEWDLPFSHIRGTAYRSTLTGMSDPRVNGELEHVMDIDMVDEGDRIVGYILAEATITNDGGSWVGTGEGTTFYTKENPIHQHHIEYTLLGTGDYDGLRFAYTVEGGDYPWDLTGTIEPVD